jgi:hypothetical protein
MNWHSKWVLAASAAAMLAVAPYAGASQSFDNDRGDIAARISMQNTFQHNGADSINWVQWRNEVRFDLRYDIIQQGVGHEWGPIKQLRFNILYRARADPVYELRDSYERRDYDRGNFEFPEGRTPRELFFDIGFGGALKDLSLRIGKQQVVWGEADLFRSLDIVNPLDLRQSGFVGEDFADFRQPLWIFKALYNFGNVASFWNEAGLEAFWSPNSRPETHQTNILLGDTWKIHANQSTPNAKYGFTDFNRNYAVPFAQMRNPWEFLRVGILDGDSPGNVQQGDGSPADFMYRIKNDVPPTELSWDAMMAGVRLLGTTVGNAYFTLNYLYKRSDGASASVPLTQILDPTQTNFGALDLGVLGAAVEDSLTPDLNGNGIPDGQDAAIDRCLASQYPTPRNTILGPLGAGKGEVILDPGTSPGGGVGWHGSAWSDPGNAQLASGYQAGKHGVPAGTNALNTDHVAYQPPLVVTTGGAPTAALQQPGPGDGLSHATFCVDVPVFHPWTHIIGGTMTYNDYDYTGLVFRLEQSFSTKEPRQLSANAPSRLIEQRDACTTPSNPNGLIPHFATGNPAVPTDYAGVPLSANCIAHSSWATARDFETRLKRYTQTWRSMVGFDYLRAIAPMYGKGIGNSLVRSLLSDQWFFTFQFLNTYDAHADDSVSNSGSFVAKYNHWNPFFTLSGSGFFMNQRLAPIWAVAADASSGFTPLFFLQIKYFITPKVELRLGEVLYMGSRKNYDPGGLSYYADRDNFYVRLTYYLL